MVLENKTIQIQWKHLNEEKMREEKKQMEIQKQQDKNWLQIGEAWLFIKQTAGIELERQQEREWRTVAQNYLQKEELQRHKLERQLFEQQIKINKLEKYHRLNYPRQKFHSKYRKQTAINQNSMGNKKLDRANFNKEPQYSSINEAVSINKNDIFERMDNYQKMK